MGVRTQSPLKTRGPDRTRSAILDGYTGRVDQDSQLLVRNNPVDPSTLTPSILKP